MHKMSKIFIIFLLFSDLSLTASEKLIPFQLEDKYGFVDENLQIIFFPEYDGYIYCYEGWAYAFKKENNATNYFILNSSSRKIKVPNDKTGFIIGKDYYGFTDLKKSEVYSLKCDSEILFDNYRLFSSSNEDFIEIENISSRPRCNYINLKGELFFSPDKDLSISWFNKDINRGVRRKNGFAYLIDSKLNNISNKKWDFVNQFSCGLALTNEGFIDYDGNLRIKITRTPEIEINFQCDVIPVVIKKDGCYELYSQEECFGGNWAILNIEGKIIKEKIEADAISSFSKDGVAVIYKFINNKANYSLINTKGEFVTDSKYDKIQKSINGFAIAKNDDEDYLINLKTGDVYPCRDF